MSDRFPVFITHLHSPELLAMTAHRIPAPTLPRAVSALAAAALAPALAAVDLPPAPVNLCVVVAAPAAQPAALALVQRAVGTDAEAGGLPAGSLLRVYWSRSSGLSEAAGAVQIRETALETVEAEDNGPRIAALLRTLEGSATDGRGVPELAPLALPAAVDYLARYAPPAAPGGPTVVLSLGPWTFGDPDPDPGLVPTEALLGLVPPRESPYGCAQAEPLPGASWFAFGAGPAGPWTPVVLAAYLRHRGAVLRDAIPAAPTADALVPAVLRASAIPPLPSALPDRPDARPGFLRVVLTLAPGAAAVPAPAILCETVEAAAAKLPTGAEAQDGLPVVLAPLPAGHPASGSLVASLVWYEDDARGPKPITADLDLWLAQDRDRLNFTTPRGPRGRLSTDLTSQGSRLDSEVIEYAQAGPDTVLGVNVYRNRAGKPALACLRVDWMGGVARLTRVLPGTGQQVTGDVPTAPGNGFRIRLGDLFPGQ